jgi:hypothetical protein
VVDSPALAPSLDEWNDEFVASDALIARLYRADEKLVLELVEPMTSRQRAGLAAFCYRRSHLHPIGLMIAATCDQLTLVQVLGTAVGTVFFNQSRERRVVPGRPGGAPRSKVTLARFQPDPHRPYVDLDSDEPDEIETVADQRLALVD